MLLNYNLPISDEDERRPISNFVRLQGFRGDVEPLGIWTAGNVLFAAKTSTHSLGLLEHFPFELLHMIFLEACTDGGGTGCSLSLVSRDVYKVSRAARFHSVSLLTPSLWKLRRFLEEYNKARDAAMQEAPRGTMPCIRHLCLLVDLPDFFHCDRLDVKPAQWDSQYPERRLYGRFRKHLLDNLRGRTKDLPSKELTRIIDAMGRRYRDSAVVTLLEQVSGDLYSLCLYQFPHLRGTRDKPQPPPLCIRVSSFPNLRELWLGGRDNHEYRAPLFLQGTSFPALKRLHMCATAGTDVLHWLSAAPRLDCLRIVADPRLLTRENGRQTFMEITGAPLLSIHRYRLAPNISDC